MQCRLQSPELQTAKNQTRHDGDGQIPAYRCHPGVGYLTNDQTGLCRPRPISLTHFPCRLIGESRTGTSMPRPELAVAWKVRWWRFR